MKEKKRELLERYIDGDLDSELNEIVQGWMISPEEEQETAQLSERLAAERYVYRKPSRKEYLNLRKLHVRLGFGSALRVRMPLRLRRSFRVAAVLLPFMVLAGTLMFTLRQFPETPPAIAAVTVSVGEGDQDYRILPDGSRVWLNESSRITYGEDFMTDRTVTLEGEAYFSVVHTADHAAFAVKANDVTVKVLGTEFNVTAYPNDSVTRVTLARGSVMVENAKRQTVTLTPDVQAVIDRVTSEMYTRAVTKQQISWSSAGREFDGATVGEVLRYIATHYKVVFAVEDRPDTDPTVRIRFNGSESLDDALFALRFVTNHAFDYTISGDTVYIIPADK